MTRTHDRMDQARPSGATVAGDGRPGSAMADGRPAARGATHAGWPLARKLPIEITLLVTTVVALFLAMAYTEVHRLSRDSVADRLQRSNQQLAQIATTGVENLRTTHVEAAGQPAVARFLANPATDRGEALVLLESLVGPDGHGAVELWDLAGRPVLAAGAEENRADHMHAAQRMLAAGRADSVRYSNFYLVGSAAYYWVSAPVLDGDRPVGYLALRRRITGSPTAEAQIRELVGEEISVFYADPAADFWLSVTGEPVPAPLRIEPSRETFEFDWPETGRRVAHGARIAGTPWVLIGALPYDAVLARPRAFLGRSVVIALGLLAVGGIGAAVTSRGLTRPLYGLARAAESIAGGDYGRRAENRRADEIGRLAETFNSMALKVQQSHAELKRKFDEAKVLAARLETSNRALEEARLAAERARAEAEAAMQLAEQARDAAESASSAKSQFLAMMSHEVRTPINAIVGYADLLQAGISGPVTKRQSQHLERIRQSSEHLMALVDELLDLARIEAGRLDVECVACRATEAIESAFALAGPEAAARSIHLEAAGRDADVPYLGDPKRVQQILANLLSNAVKFTPAGGRVTVNLGVPDPAERPGFMYIAVEDTGIGISPEETDRIFLPFVQVDSGSTRSRGGTGLGLAISHRLARLMGGDITVTSTKGVGSRFTLLLPMAEHAGEVGV